jgi:hypothetical protein
VTTDPVIARLAASNPFPAPPATASTRLRLRPRRRLLAAAIAAALASVPAGAFADDIGGLLGFSTQGQPVATRDTALSQVSGLKDAMQELGFPSTLRLLDRREGIGFYAARRASGNFCFAIERRTGEAGVGCVLGGPSFPSPERPILDFSRFSHGARLIGFAADGVANVYLLDDSGRVIASAPVVNNVYANADPPAGAVAVEAVDSHGTVVYRRSFDQAP